MSYSLFVDPNDDPYVTPRVGPWKHVRSFPEAQSLFDSEGWPAYLSIDASLDSMEDSTEFVHKLVDFVLDAMEQDIVLFESLAESFLSEGFTVHPVGNIDGNCAVSLINTLNHLLRVLRS